MSDRRESLRPKVTVVDQSTVLYQRIAEWLRGIQTDATKACITKGADQRDVDYARGRLSVVLEFMDLSSELPTVERPEIGSDGYSN